MASLFTSEIKGIQAMDVQRKLAIPADAAKYDASCASSGIETQHSPEWRAAVAKIGARGLVSQKRERHILPLSSCGRGWLREAKTGEGSRPIDSKRTPHPARTSHSRCKASASS